MPIEKVVEKIKKCTESLSSERVESYLRYKKINEKLSMSVIVQEMIKGDMSGVMFTANPQGILNESVIVIGYGRGDGVVEEKVPVTSYYYNNTDKLYYYEKMENSPVIDKEQVEKLISYGEELKELFGKYLDIEFTIKDEKIYILQVRL